MFFVRTVSERHIFACKADELGLYAALHRMIITLVALKDGCAGVLIAAAIRPVGLDVLFVGAGWSSPVARQAHNLKVVGSNPTPATNSTNTFLF